MLHFRTQGFNGYNVKYSPFFDSRLAVAASANFGLVGNGRLYVLSLTADGIACEKSFDTQDGLFDLAWSESHENQVAVASGDGSIKLFDIALKDFPIQSYHEHKREAFSVSWNMLSKLTFASSSWDGTVKIWSPNRPHSLVTLATNSCTYSTLFSPHSAHMLSAVSSDSLLRVFDTRAPPASGSQITIPAHPGHEVLTQDWNKYRPDTIVTAGVDRAIRVWDLRGGMTGVPVSEMLGHEYAVRRVACSPHLGDVVLSASYDMTCRVWNDGCGSGLEQPMPSTHALGTSVTRPGRQLGVFDRHTEFCVGVDWCMFGAEGWAASVGWDEAVWVWDVRAVMG